MKFTITPGRGESTSVGATLNFGRSLSYVVLYVLVRGHQGPLKHCVLGLVDWDRHVVWPVFDPSRLVLPIVGYRGIAALVPSDWVEVEEGKPLHETGHTVVEVMRAETRPG